jgi:hypothetical protein
MIALGVALFWVLFLSFYFLRVWHEPMTEAGRALRRAMLQGDVGQTPLAASQPEPLTPAEMPAGPVGFGPFAHPFASLASGRYFSPLLAGSPLAFLGRFSLATLVLLMVTVEELVLAILVGPMFYQMLAPHPLVAMAAAAVVVGLVFLWVYMIALNVWM